MRFKLFEKIHCSTCTNYYNEGPLCGYSATMCKIYGCLENPSNPHYGCNAKLCKDYIKKEENKNG